MARPCPFCRLSGVAPDGVFSVPSGELLAGSERSVAFLDGFPCAGGHVLVVPRRHVGRLGELTAEEAADLWDLVGRLLPEVAASCDGVNVGVNDGMAAGQTIGHVHVHLIPRRVGDVPDPRGGVRWVLPERADYWSPG